MYAIISLHLPIGSIFAMYNIENNFRVQVWFQNELNPTVASHDGVAVMWLWSQLNNYGSRIHVMETSFSFHCGFFLWVLHTG